MKKALSFEAKDIPTGPGVYRFFDASEKLIYVGKAVNLRRRLSQYLMAKRIKKHQKMKSILKAAVTLSYETCESNTEAEMLETRLIQKHRPEFNVVGAYHFMYPLIAMSRGESGLNLCLTTSGERGAEFTFYGSFRSREICRNAFDALDELLVLVGHRQPYAGVKSQFSTYRSYRRLEGPWFARLDDFFRGKSPALLEELILALVEKPSARLHPKDVQRNLKALKKFWNHEVRKLCRAIERCSWTSYPVAQEERDLLFIRHRSLRPIRPVRPEKSAKR